MKSFWIASLLIALAACGGGGSGGDGPVAPPPVSSSVKVTCLDLHEQGTTTACAPGGAGAARLIAAAAAATRSVDLGQVSRGVEAALSSGVNNTRPARFTGHIVYWTNLDCNGRTDPWIMAEGGFNVAAGATEFGNVSLQCGDATPGAKWFRIDIFESDRTTLVDQVVGDFRLVE